MALYFKLYLRCRRRLRKFALPISLILVLSLFPFKVSAETVNQPDGDYSYCRSGICAGDLEQYYMYSVEASIVYDGDLIVGGYFAAADGIPVCHLARGDGAAWHDLGGGVSGSYANAVFALAIYNGKLIVGEEF